jgi:hypothetical protein
MYQYSFMMNEWLWEVYHNARFGVWNVAAYR